MSSTKRGGKRSEADFYPTPSWCVDRLLERVTLPGGPWLEPGAGNGAIIKAVNARRTDVEWAAVELRSECSPDLVEVCVKKGGRMIRADFLNLGPYAGLLPYSSVALGNPPFSLAEDFVVRALEFATDVFFLLRLNFIESDRRHAWMAEHMPDIYVLPNRPCFSGPKINRKGKLVKNPTDSITYAWFHWNANTLNRTAGKVELLDLTPKDIRRKKQ